MNSWRSGVEIVMHENCFTREDAYWNVFSIVLGKGPGRVSVSDWPLYSEAL